jgi:hypothetical protein
MTCGSQADESLDQGRKCGPSQWAVQGIGGKRDWVTARWKKLGTRSGGEGANAAARTQRLSLQGPAEEEACRRVWASSGARQTLALVILVRVCASRYAVRGARRSWCGHSEGVDLKVMSRGGRLQVSVDRFALGASAQPSGSSSGERRTR